MALGALSDAQTDRGPTQKAGSASVNPGGATLFTDHRGLSGPQLPLQLQNLLQPGSPVRLPHGDQLAHPQKLREKDMAVGPWLQAHITAWCCQPRALLPLGTRERSISSPQPVLFNALLCSMPQPAPISQAMVQGHPHNSSERWGPDPALGTTRGFPRAPAHSASQAPTGLLHKGMRHSSASTAEKACVAPEGWALP